jgi:hypothetical protein
MKDDGEPPCVLRQAQDEEKSSWYEEKPHAELVEARTIPTAICDSPVRKGGLGKTGSAATIIAT